MNVFEIVHQVNNRLYGDDVSKFDMVFIIVNEFLYSYKVYCREQFARGKLLSGDFDSNIVGLINEYMNELALSDGNLSMLEYFNEEFKFFRLVLSEPDINLDIIPSLLGDDNNI